MRAKLLQTSAVFLTISAGLTGAALAQKPDTELLCVDKSNKPWTKAADLHDTYWKERTDANSAFSFQNAGHLEAFWPFPDAWKKGLSPKALAKLQAFEHTKVSFKDAVVKNNVIESSRGVTFVRTFYPTPSTDELNDGLKREWPYILNFASDCQSLFGTVVYTKDKDGKPDLTARVTFNLQSK